MDPTANCVCVGGGGKPFKSGAETRRRIKGHSELKPATPAADLMPNILLCFPLDHTRESERGVLMSGQPSSSIQLPRLAPWRGCSSAAVSATDQHGRQQLRGISAKLHQSRTARMARRNTCFLSLPMDATVQHCPATVPAVTGIDRPN